MRTGNEALTSQPPKSGKVADKLSGLPRDDAGQKRSCAAAVKVAGGVAGTVRVALREVRAVCPVTVQVDQARQEKPRCRGLIRKNPGKFRRRPSKGDHAAVDRYNAVRHIQGRRNNVPAEDELTVHGPLASRHGLFHNGPAGIRHKSCTRHYPANFPRAVISPCQWERLQ
ncbi:hypothetical protein NicSoilC5_22890 [Arthrobacter sp. NicSoilC5]|nr:hypothetical protein NicSoilC5_22890 [Arthrobacter sp. NicSoilC5]